MSRAQHPLHAPLGVLRLAGIATLPPAPTLPPALCRCGGKLLARFGMPAPQCLSCGECIVTTPLEATALPKPERVA